MTGGLRLATAGIAMVGTGFGMARYGYGLLLPDMRATYHLGTAALGAISAGAYVGYLCASIAVGGLAGRLGLRLTVVAGGACGVGGMLLAAFSRNAEMLALGMLVAGASAGLVFPPFSDAVAAGVRPDRRGRVLSSISAGTGWGVALAAPVAILAGAAWRSAWLAFAVAMVLATLWAARVLPARAAVAAAAQRAPLHWRWLVCPRSGPLLVGATLVGLGSSVYWTFAVDFLVSSDAVSLNASRGFLLVVGVASIVGSAAGDVIRRTGARAAFAAMTWALAASVALLALSPGVPALAVPSAILFGAAYNLVLAVQGIWSAEVFADRPSTGLAAVMFALGSGLLLGPLLAGLVAGAVAMKGVFLIAAALLGAVSLLAPRETLNPAPAIAGHATRSDARL